MFSSAYRPHITFCRALKFTNILVSYVLRLLKFLCIHLIRYGSSPPATSYMPLSPHRSVFSCTVPVYRSAFVPLPLISAWSSPLEKIGFYHIHTARQLHRCSDVPMQCKCMRGIRLSDSLSSCQHHRCRLQAAECDTGVVIPLDAGIQTLQLIFILAKKQSRSILGACKAVRHPVRPAVDLFLTRPSILCSSQIPAYITYSTMAQAAFPSFVSSPILCSYENPLSFFSTQFT